MGIARSVILRKAVTLRITSRKNPEWRGLTPFHSLDIKAKQREISTHPLHIAMKTLQVRVSDDLRTNADAVLEDIGLDMPTAIRLYLNKIVQTRSIPFTLEANGVAVEELGVDAATQTKMDAIANAWRKTKS